MLLVLMVALLAGSCTAGRVSKNSANVAQTPSANKNQSTPPAPPDGRASPTESTLFSTDKVTRITRNNYDEVIGSQRVVLLLFWAPWSAPDRMIAPAIVNVANEYSGRARTGTVNVDDEPELAQKFGVKGIPTIVILSDGTEQERVVGVVPKRRISDMLDKQLTNKP